ncbi:hypothetical protein MPTK1_3g17550 [Marchantia polymorpha subsp. ruderalis]|uniref:Uncharacterized protein n=2 Tax=Marchantia polymorpha TaxID=3197 RepID=A0AAF6B1V9_MARPO|nr:hypothetical protein MARPO_0039s0039 [Marchantia polymorpha]BBN05993.1 hypothetical protein Mp_3g17550 [Marchantia polymorpha subsp. ruderalis]|eukprot:PTQ40531.1 hypothetical protein MARPO_0039s0039 [Marchantia polymorpha]
MKKTAHNTKGIAWEVKIDAGYETLVGLQLSASGVMETTNVTTENRFLRQVASGNQKWPVSGGVMSPLRLEI